MVCRLGSFLSLVLTKKKRRKQKCNDIVTKRKEKKIEEEKTNQRATLVFLFHSIGGYFPDFRFLFRGQNRVDFFFFSFPISWLSKDPLRHKCVGGHDF